jgi:hypothetical protein
MRSLWLLDVRVGGLIAFGSMALRSLLYLQCPVVPYGKAEVSDMS